MASVENERPVRSLRIGVVGVGGMGAFHARTLAGLGGVDVVAVADPHEPNAVATAEAVGAEAFTDPLALASSEELDGVVIASPDATHPELAIAALERGTFVLCEKPLATTVGDARRVVDAELALGRRLVQVGFMRQYDPAHVQVAAALPSIGRIDYLRAVHRNAGADPRPLERVVCQSMVHDIHSVRFLTGEEFAAVTAFASGPFPSGGYRHVLAVCTLTSGAHASLEFDDTAFAYEVSVEVVGADGDLLTGGPVRATRRHGGSLDVHLGTDWFGWFAEAYRIQDAAWIASIRENRTSGPSVWDGYVAQMVVDAVIRSSTSGRTEPVELPEHPGLYA